MSKVRMPQMAEDASGQFGKNIVYATWKGRPHSRIKVVPQNPRTDKQVVHRTLFKEAVKSYKQLTDEQKQTWNAAAEAEKMTGLNLYVRDYFKAEREGVKPLDLPKAT